MNHRVLVLNQDYSPVSICSVQRAFLLIYLNKTELVQESIGKHIRTVNRSFPMPAVIRLMNYVNVPYRGVELTRHNIFKRDGYECQYCGDRNRDNLTLDHVIPRAKGGGSSWTNLITACKSCNSKKGDLLPEEAGMPLKNQPFKPSYIMFLRDFSGFHCDEWKPFLSKRKISA